MAELLSRGDRGRMLSDVEVDLDAEASRSAVIPLRFLGMGFLIAWLCSTHIASVYCGDFGELRRAMDAGMRVGDIATFIVLACAARRIGPLGARTNVTVPLVVLTSLGTLAIGLWLSPCGFAPFGMSCVGCVTAIGGAVLFCLWAEIYSQLGTRRIVVYGAGSCVVAFLAYVLVVSMKQQQAIVLTSLFPLLSLACALTSFNLVPHERVHARTSRYAVPWKIVAIMSIAGFISGYAGAFLLTPEEQGAVHRIWGTGAAGVIILALALWRSDRFDIRHIAATSVPLGVVAFALIPVSGSHVGLAISFLVKFAYVWFTLFALMLLANLAFRFDLPTLRMFAIARACSEGAMFAGMTLRRFVQGQGLTQDMGVLLLCSLVGIVAIAVCVLLWKSEPAVNADWGTAGIELESGERVVSPRERLIDRCEQLAEEYGLTAREAEVLALLAQRKTRSEIEQELFLSQNTVKTHIRHVYAKLDVHSKEDVYDLVGE